MQRHSTTIMARARACGARRL